MKRAFLVGLVLLMAFVAVPSGIGAPGGCTDNPVLQPMGFEQITVSTASIGFTANTFAPSGGFQADLAVVGILTANVRYRDDGGVPDTNTGQVGVSASSITVCGLTTIRQIRFIRDDAADATLTVSYYRGSN